MESRKRPQPSQKPSARRLLKFHKETVRHLSPTDLRQVHGAYDGVTSYECPVTE